MSKKVIELREQVRTLLIEALGRCIADGALPANPAPDFQIEAPADKSHGDFASNIAMVSAKAFHAAPEKLPRRFAAELILPTVLSHAVRLQAPDL